MQRVLVSGGAGFIGSNFIRYLLEMTPDAQVVNLDALTYAGSLENLREVAGDERYTFLQGDICDRTRVDQVLRQYQIDSVVHFAAESHVDRSILGPAPFVQTNVTGTFTLLEAARHYWLDEKAFPREQVRFHHISTDEVYGSLAPEDPPFSETTPYAPNSPYAASKAGSDHLVRAYFHTYGLPVTVTNCSNNYGPYQFPEKLIPLMILNALEGKSLPLYGDGGQIRDWLYVEDHCQAIQLVLERGLPGETYNVGGGNQPTNLELVEMICDLLDEYRPLGDGGSYRELISFVPDRPGHDRRYAIDPAKIKAQLGWQPRHSLEDGLRRTVSWYLEHQAWVEAIRKEHGYQSWLEQNYAHREGKRS